MLPKDSTVQSRAKTMELPQVVEVALYFAAMIRVQGPDPKGLKMRKHAFHHYNCGQTTLSASAMLVPRSVCLDLFSRAMSRPNVTLVLTVASVIEPFLSSKRRDHISQGRPELISGVQIDILIERKPAAEGAVKGEDLQWMPAELLALIDVPSSSVALQSLLEASFGSSEHGWEVGWSLTSLSNGQHFMETSQIQQNSEQSLANTDGAESSSPSLMSKSATRIAVLGISSLIVGDVPNLKMSSKNKRGDLLVAVGAPFGVMSPLHFANSISVGSIANCYPPGSSDGSLLMADIRCLPGMEGSPVFGINSELIGILTRPLRQKGSRAEVQLVMPWGEIASACKDLLLEEHLDELKIMHCNRGSSSDVFHTSIGYDVGSKGLFNQIPKYPVEDAMASVCLITVNGAWASGVLLNDHGLILTNAHLLEPWRFRKGASTEGDEKAGATILLSQTLLPQEENSDQKKYEGFGNIGLHGIQVRLDHVYPWIWCDASVFYVSKGPLDVALLKLVTVPEKVHPIEMELGCPSLGSEAYVIGHGLFGSRCDFLPSICSGVVAKVVKANRFIDYQSSEEKNGLTRFPVMIETTAAVYPGSSGGAVVNSNGHMIGLVTSNARHGGGTIIPHLNFSIPCAAMEQIFKFSKDMQDFSLLEDLDKSNEELSSVWALMPPLSHKPSPTRPTMLPGEQSKNAKGTRFAKFISERSDLFESISRISKTESASAKNVRSKL